MMYGAQMRCVGCNQYAPDRCLCGTSISDPAIKSNMAAARAAFEADIIAEYGPSATRGSPHYVVTLVMREWRTFWRVWQAATAYAEDKNGRLTSRKAAFDSSQSTSQESAQATPAALMEMSQLLHAEDNCGTSDPIFIVQQKRTYVTEEGYNDDRYVWHETTSSEHHEASPMRAARLESLHQQGRELEGWKRLSVFDNWEFVTACFTRKGCEDYLARNGHNLRESRIYVDSAFRNTEFLTMRQWLMSLTPSAQKQENI